MKNDLIENFISNYKREQYYYESLAKKCADLCQKIIVQDTGIKAVITYRSKNPSSLKNKLLKRNEIKNYQNIEEIRKDIIDLAGVRIALFFIDDQYEVENILKDNFYIQEIIKPNTNTNTNSQPSYYGTNYRLNPIKEMQGFSFQKEDVVEVQVMSILHEVWAEIQHDIEYKPNISFVDDAIKKQLDDLFMHVQMGEFKVKNIYKGYRAGGVASIDRKENTSIKKLKTKNIIQGETSRHRYWYASDKKRYVFPTDMTFNTWFFNDEPNIIQLADKDLEKIPLGGNITYKPGVRLIKTLRDTKIYAVSKGGMLRLITSNEIAKQLYGENWENLVDIIPDPFFINYSIGKDIINSDDYNPQKEKESSKLQ